MIFHGQIKDGEFHHFNPRAWEDCVAGLPTGRYVLRLEKPKKRGSTNQQRYYFSCLVGRIMEYIGEHGNEGAERVHCALMERYFPVREVGELRMRESYMNLDSAQREKYHESIRIDAANGDLLGSPLVLPLPNEAEVERW